MHSMLRFAPLVAVMAFPVAVSAQVDDFDDQESLEQFDIGFDGKSSGYYIQVSGMIVDVRDQDAGAGESAFGAGAADGEVSFDTGFGLSAAIGYEFETAPFRVEFEYTYRDSDIDELDTGGAGSFSADGSIESHAFMFNGIFDFAFAGTPFSWYAGAGIGFAYIEGDLDSDAGGAIIDAGSGDDTQFAWQVMTGVEYQIDEHFTLFGGFRFFEGNEPEFDFASFEYDSLNYELGLRYYF